MIENIAIIKEVKELMSTKEAHGLALDLLKKINLENISAKRTTTCSAQEEFYVMFIRALMTRERTIIIQRPFSIINNLRDINTLIKNIEILNKDKDIIILDTIINKIHYKECSCSMIK